MNVRHRRYLMRPNKVLARLETDVTFDPARPQLKVVLRDINPRVVEAWLSAFADTPAVEVHKGSLLDQAADAWVSPTNARGRMDGGIDAAIKGHLGAGIQLRVQRAIQNEFGGQLPVG